MLNYLMKPYISMRKFYLFVFLLASINLFGQNTRYLDDVFTGVERTEDLVYTSAHHNTYDSLFLDVYEPLGDTETNRPLIILAHGGSFVAGSKENPTMVTLCESFARKGYVTASIQYRLGNVFDMLDSLSMINVVMKALSDAKSAIRYFRMDAAGANSFNINSNMIFFGGNSAGGVIGSHLGILSSVAELGSDQYLVDILNSNGGIEGNSGNDGYSSDINGVINLAGAINKTSWIDSSDKPIISCHGDNDGTVPYNCGNALGLGTLPQLCGSGSMKPVLDQKGVKNELLLFPGDDHVPWEANSSKMNQVIDVVKNFLYELMNPTSISDFNTNVVGVYPNPSSGLFYISSDVKCFDVSVYNSVGALIYYTNQIKENRVDLTSMPSGFYTLVVTTKNQSITKKIALQ